jgi:FG-GAP repeat
VNVFNVTGTQLGAYFGYSVCASDVDGDGFQDLVVGAPLFTELDNNEGKYETGRVYIYYQGQEVSHAPYFYLCNLDATPPPLLIIQMSLALAAEQIPQG